MVGGHHFQDEIETAEQTLARRRREEKRLGALRLKYHLSPDAGEYAIALARIKTVGARILKPARRG